MSGRFLAWIIGAATEQKGGACIDWLAQQTRDGMDEGISRVPGRKETKDWPRLPPAPHCQHLEPAPPHPQAQNNRK